MNQDEDTEDDELPPKVKYSTIIEEEEFEDEDGDDEPEDHTVVPWDPRTENFFPIQ